MRVLLFHDVAQEIGGAETYTFRLLRALNAQGHPAKIVVLSSTPIPPRENTVVIPEPSSKLARFLLKATFSPTALFSLLREIDSFKPDVIHLHHNNKAPAAVFLAAWLKKIPVVQTVHDFGFACPTIWHAKPHGAPCCESFGINCVQNGCISPIDYAKELCFRPLKRLLDKAFLRLIICPSLALQKCILQEGFKTRLLPYFIDCPQKIKRAPMASKTILYAGGLTRQKGVHVLLQAFALVLKKIPSAKLKIIGDGNYSQELKRLSRELEMGDKVDFVGKVPNAEMGKHYPRASVVAVPSVWVEQFGLVGVEAMSYGVPVVGSNIGGIPEWLEDGKTGFLSKPGNAVDLASQLEKILLSPALARKMGLGGRRAALEKYCSSKRHVSRLIEIYLNASQ